jgi:glycosidase
MKVHPDDTELHRVTKQEITLKSRDNARTPMQWSNTPYAGFSTAKPWQKENESYTAINAESQVGVKDSVFEYWASILRLRKQHVDVFIYGDFEMVDEGHGDVFAYKRTFEKQSAVVVCNFRNDTIEWEVPNQVVFDSERLLVGNYQKANVSGEVLKLRPFEAFACYLK